MAMSLTKPIQMKFWAYFLFFNQKILGTSGISTLTATIVSSQVFLKAHTDEMQSQLRILMGHFNFKN